MALQLTYEDHQRAPFAQNLRNKQEENIFGTMIAIDWFPVPAGEDYIPNWFCTEIRVDVAGWVRVDCGDPGQTTPREFYMQAGRPEKLYVTKVYGATTGQGHTIATGIHIAK